MPRRHHLSEGRALAIGWVWVNGPVFVLLFGPLGAALFVTRGAEEVSAVFFATAFFGGFAAAWLWWSVMLPKWRLWSYARVANPLAIKYRSVEVQLAWPDGSFFSRTEIKSPGHAAKEAQWERRAYEANGPYQPPPQVEETMEQKAKAFFLFLVPLLLIFSGLVFYDRLAGDPTPAKHNAALLLFGLMAIGMPYAYKRLGAEFVGWERFLPRASVLAGLVCFAVIDFSSIRSAARVALVPLVIVLAGRAWISYLANR